MWVLLAFASAIFAGLTAILAKVGIKDIDSNVATALRTIVVLIFSWVMVFISGSQSTISDISPKTLLFLVLSGMATGASWLCYFRALQIGDVNKVVPIDKSSIILTMLMAFFLLGEEITIIKVIAMICIGTGTYMMIQRKESIKSEPESRLWIFYALGAAIFASLTSIFGKVGIEGIDSTLGTAIRTIVVLIMAWAVVFITGKHNMVRKMNGSNLLFLTLSGFATGGSWLCYYRALQMGPASVVVPIDKLSILLTIGFSYVFLKERLNRKSVIGLGLIVLGTLSLLF